MAGVNKAIIVGNVGQEPEVRYMPNGDAVATVSIATSDSWKNKQTGEKQERTEWHRIVFFGKIAEIAGKYVNKGSKLYVEGRLHTRKWQDQQGIERYTTEIVVDMRGSMQLLDSRQNIDGNDNQNQAPQQQSTRNQGQKAQRPNPQRQKQGPAKQPVPNFDDFDDDIPF